MVALFKREKAFYHDLFWAALSAFFLTLSFPSADLGWLAWVALVPMLVRAQSLSSTRAFKLGLFAGTLHYASLLFWLVGTLHLYGGMSQLAGLGALLLLSVYLGLYPAVFFWANSRWRLSPLGQMLFFPALWVALEYGRTYFFTGFPWGLLGYTQHRFLTLIQGADVTGVYGLSFLVVMANSAVAFWLGRRIFQKTPDKGAWVPWAVGALFFGSALGYGYFALGNARDLSQKAPHLKVAVLQGNIDQSKKWDASFRKRTLDVYEGLAGKAKALSPELVVMPETALPFYFLRNRSATEKTMSMVRKSGASWIAGAPAAEAGGEQWRYFNRAYGISPDGDLLGAYDKVHLVPFGEYVPLKTWLFFVEKLVVAAGDFSPGKKGSLITGGHKSPWRAGGQICFESIFPWLSVASVRAGANILVNLTNDAWFGASSAPFQHLQMARFRAIETRRSLVRSANTGISGFVLPTGEVVQKIPLFEEAWRVGRVPLLEKKSIYVRVGDLFAWICLFASFGWAIFWEVRAGHLRREKKVPLP